MGKKDIHYSVVCLCVFVCLLGESGEESPAVQNSENSPQSSADVIMKEDAEEMFYNIDLKKYDGIQCPDPVPPENGAIVGEGNQVGSVVYVVCREGYKLEGPTVMACVPVTDGAQWDPPVLRACLLETESSQETDVEITGTEQENEPKHQEKKSINSPTSLKPWQNHNVEKEEPRDVAPENTNMLSPECLEKPDEGPCRAVFKRYYFSKTTMECHTFTYGGCRGNKNNFLTIKDCNLACLRHE